MQHTGDTDLGQAAIDLSPWLLVKFIDIFSELSYFNYIRNITSRFISMILLHFTSSLYKLSSFGCSQKDHSSKFNKYRKMGKITFNFYIVLYTVKLGQNSGYLGWNGGGRWSHKAGISRPSWETWHVWTVPRQYGIHILSTALLLNVIPSQPLSFIWHHFVQSILTNT